MHLSNITVRHDQAKPCHFRDIAEPVEFDVAARLRITISRFADVPPVTAERLLETLAAALEEHGITRAEGGNPRDGGAPRG